MKSVSSCLRNSAQIQNWRTFDLTSMAQLWPAQRGAPILVRHEALNQHTRAVSSQPALMASPVRTKAEDRSTATLYFQLMCDFIRGLCSFLRFFMCRMSGESLPATHLFTTISPAGSISFSPLHPVHHRWK